MKITKYFFMFLVCTSLLAKEPKLVKVRSVNPNIRVELPYATVNNFTNVVQYPSCADAYLLPGVAEKLSQVQNYLEKKGLGLKVLDAFRPIKTQWGFWDAVQDERYVSNPAKGGEGGRHPRGTAVDVTLVCLSDGKELLMPTEFDDFSEKAHSDYMDLPKEVLRNRKILQDAMEMFGFTRISCEWWHFDIENWKEYPVLEDDFDTLVKAEQETIPKTKPV